MSTLEAIQYSISTELDLLNQRIMRQLSTDNAFMHIIVDSYLRTKGKQIRPIIVLLTAKMIGNVNDNVLAAATSVELLHNASLIHDDVVDNSPVRRSTPTINAIWDNHIAVLVGDFFVSTAMRNAIDTGNIRIISSLCHLGKLLSLGELDQIYNARYHQLTEEAYYRIIEFKTASLFIACAQMGAIAAGATQEQIDRVSEFARLMGLAFQMRDDILDYYDEKTAGKPTGNDLREGKITLPLLHVLLDESAPCHRQMNELAASNQLSDDDIATLIRYAHDNGGIEYTYRQMHSLRDKAVTYLAPWRGTEAADSLIALFDSIVQEN